MQNGCVSGGFVATAGEDLSAYGLGAGNGGDYRLVKLANSSGDAVVKRPEANDDACLYVLTGGAASGEAVAIDPIDAATPVMVTLKGTCNPGDDLVLADVATPADKGKLRKLPGTAGTYLVYGKAEEAGVDGQQVWFRPGMRVVTVG